MKKFLLAVMAVLFCTAMATAQLVESRTGGAHIYNVKNPPPEMRYYIKLGGGVLGSLSPYIEHNESESLSTGPAADLQFGFERHFKYNSNWYWGGKIGVGFSSHSFDYSAWENTYTGGHYSDYNHEGEEYYHESIQQRSEGSSSMTPINIHIGPTIGFCKPISSNVKLNIGLTPELVYFSGKLNIPWTETYYRYKEANDRHEVENTYEHNDSYNFDSLGVSGTLSFDLLINKFIVGVNGKCNFLFDSDFGETIYGAMFNIGYVF
jgi:opacity protein-like surface antigen